MSLFSGLRVSHKLGLLAGVPVLGILALSVLVVLEVQERAEAAAGLGSIEDLAQLTEKMLSVIDELQWERAQVTHAAGIGLSGSPEVQRRQQQTDTALAGLTSFLATRDEQKLPAKLRQDLNVAQAQLRALPSIRLAPAQPDFELLGYLEFYAKVNDSMIAATAGLTQLSEDKQLLLSIGGLVNAMQVIERNAREHALLNYVFGKQEFPPGTFRYFVTLLTEQQVYTDSLRTWASEEDFKRLSSSLQGPFAEQIAVMRAVAVDTTEGTFSVEAQRWFDTQNSNMEALARLERAMAGDVRQVVLQKKAEVQHAVRLAMGLVLVVVLASVLIGWAITRGLTRSVRVLSSAAEAVNQNHDFTLRAQKTSGDELGLLTDAFNGMLAGIQERDGELAAYRQNLESLVEARTRQLSERNEEMALVLDNVDQGLAMIDRDGKFLGESSRAFKESFGPPEPGTPFYKNLVADDDQKSFELECGYEQLIAELLPVELALDQMPKSIVRDTRQFSLAFTPVRHGDQLTGALLVTRDVTHELLARKTEAEQRERVRIFERIMRDRVGFQEFVQEARRLITSLRNDAGASQVERMRTLHTLKGVAAVSDASSVSAAAHELEQALTDDTPERVGPARERLFASWEAFMTLVAPVAGDDVGRRVEISRDELGDLIDGVRTQAPYPVLLHSLIRLTYEPIEQRFLRIEDQLKRVARRLGKPEPLVVMEAGDVRLPADRFRPFWSSMAHVVRNMVDHGFELEDDRIARGKGRQNQVELRAVMSEGGLLIEVADDGRGIDWERLAQKAREKGLPAETRADLARAVFADGVSTAGTVSQASGRGVGMSAVEESCVALGGSASVESELGRGTRFRFVFPPLDDTALETSELLASRRPSHMDSLSPSYAPGQSLLAPERAN
jgi:two-component system, chemotaxis family, sensor kinase CheA